MDSSVGQSERTEGAREQATTTRTRLLDAAASLIATQGWARVTTRAVAEAAELPHGTVSYHFRGKQELLRHAAMHAVERAFGDPDDLLAGFGSTREALPLLSRLVHNPGLRDPVLTGALLETLREAERDTELRDWVAEVLRGYRRAVADLVRSDQSAGELSAELDADGLATLFVAASDGLLLHLMLDPEIGVESATGSLLTLLKEVSGDAR